MASLSIPNITSDTPLEELKAMAIEAINELDPRWPTIGKYHASQIMAIVGEVLRRGDAVTVVTVRDNEGACFDINVPANKAVREFVDTNYPGFDVVGYR